MERMPLPADRPKQVIIKAEDETDPNYGSDPYERTPLSEYIRFGVINLDKPAGPTSHEVAAWVKKILGVKKAGHGGTLDPGVTGILPVALEDAVKAIRAVQTAGKEYVCLMRLHRNAEETAVKGALNLFTGEIWQIPPLKSAVARNLRKRRIYYIDYLEKKDRLVLFRVGCQAGTYVRKLCVDIGEILLTGASMEELRRTRVGFFAEDDSLVTLQDLHDAVYIYENEGDESYLRKVIQPIEVAVKHYDKVVIRDSAVDAICHGADLTAPGVLRIDATVEKGKEVAIMTLKGELVAFGTALRSALKMASVKSGKVVKTTRVIMPRKTYPYFKKNRE